MRESTSPTLLYRRLRRYSKTYFHRTNKNIQIRCAETTTTATVMMTMLMILLMLFCVIFVFGIVCLCLRKIWIYMRTASAYWRQKWRKWDETMRYEWHTHSHTHTHPANVRLAMAAAVAADTMFWDLTATSCSDVLTHTENRQLRRSRHHTHTHTRRTIKWKIVWFEKMKKREEKPSSWLWWCDVFIMRTECFVLGNGETTNRRERILNYTHRSCV